MKKHWLWFAEVLVWLLILFSLASLMIISIYNHKKSFNTYQIFMPDVDGLINGSPVKLMGIQVGYVNQINIVGEDIYVKFVINQKHVRIPYGTVATVEFSGLGGSKSLELYPPDKKPQIQTKFIVSQSPKRIHDSLGLLNDMFNHVIDITYYISNFADKMGVTKPQKCYNEVNPVNYTNDFINNSNGWLKNATIQTEKFKNKLLNKKGGKNGTNYSK